MDSPEKLLNAVEVGRMIGLSKTTVMRMRVDGRLPTEIILSRETIRWRYSDILKWIEMGCPNEKKFKEAKK